MSVVQRTGSVLAVAVLLAACGGSSSAEHVPTADEGRSAAAAINLKAIDLSAFKGLPHDAKGETGTDDVAFAACVGASEPHTDEVSDVYSDDLSKGEGAMISQVSSEVSVVSNTDTASKDVKAFKSGKATNCLDKFVTRLLSKEAGGATFSKPSVKSLDVNKDGIDDAFGYEVTVQASAGSQSIPFTISLLAMLKDHTEVSLTTLSIGGSLSVSERDGFAETLRGRLKTSAV
jgi:hypothetical protein